MNLIPALPIIDFADRHAKVVRDLGKACEEYGCFAVVNHNITMNELLDLNADAKNFFALPLQDKLLSVIEGSGSGYIPFQVESLGGSSGDLYKGDLKESFNFSSKDYLGDVYPYVPPSLINKVSKYFNSMITFTDLLMAGFAQALNLNHAYFTERIGIPSMVLRMAYYPAQEHKPAENQFRASPHTDYGTVTMVWASDMRGLQSYYRESGVWLDADNLPPDALYVNLGDMMQIWTNDKWKAALHRVVVPQEHSGDRLSLVLFHNPSDDCIIEPVSTCVSKGYPAKYEALSARTHRKTKTINSMQVIEK